LENDPSPALDEEPKKAWDILVRLLEKYPSNNFIFKEEEHPLWSERIFLVINKKNFENVVDRNKEDFVKILGYKRDLLDESKTKNLLKDVLLKHDVLFGIIFGFGRSNALAFYENTLKKQRDRNKGFIDYDYGEKIRFFLHVIFYRKGLRRIHRNLLTLPGFAVVPSEETDQLLKEYKKTRKKILNYYSKGDVFELTWHLLHEDNS